MDNLDLADRLKEVLDPEVGVNIVDLGLIYGLVDDGEYCTVIMTMTTPTCPMSDFLEAEIHRVCADLGKPIRVDWVWNPPWDRTMISPQARLALGLE